MSTITHLTPIQILIYIYNGYSNPFYWSQPTHQLCSTKLQHQCPRHATCHRCPGVFNYLGSTHGWNQQKKGQWLFLVPLKGGRWHIIPQLAVYTTYIPLIVLAFWGVICYRSHLLGEPERTIERGAQQLSWQGKGPFGSLNKSLTPLFRGWYSYQVPIYLAIYTWMFRWKLVHG